MNTKLLDLYSDYLISSFSATTATGLSRMLDNAVSHDQVSRMLNSERLDSKAWWLMVKPQVRIIQREDGVILIDDSIEEKALHRRKRDRMLALRPRQTKYSQRHQFHYSFVPSE